MRILTVGSLYPPHHLGGYELVWQAAVRALHGAGHEVRVLCVADRFPDRPQHDEDPAVRRELRWYWRDHAFPRLSRRERKQLEAHNRAVFADELASRPDVVSWWAMGGMSLALIEQARGVPAIGWVNDDWMVYGPHVDQSVKRRQLDFASAARWVFCSDAMRKSALRVWPRLQDTTVLHQGVAADFTPAAARPWQGRLLYAGRLDERKGLLTLLEAVEQTDVTLRIVGDGDPSILDKLRASARVTIEPGVPRGTLQTVYAASDAVVFPVEWIEPYGLVPLEAMAVGRPVIATGMGGSGEYLEHEGNALLFAPKDANALAAAISRLAADEGLRARLREGGFETAARLTEARWTAAVVDEHERLTRPA